MDNYSDINLKGGSKINVGDSLTISDSGVLGSDNKPKYLEVEYGEYGQAIPVDSKVCFADINVSGEAEFINCVSFSRLPTSLFTTTPTEDNQFATKKYVDDKVGSGSSGCQFSSIKVVNPQCSYSFTELKYKCSDFTLTNQCGTTYIFPEDYSGSSREIITDQSFYCLIAEGFCTKYVCTNEVEVSDFCGNRFGRIFATTESGLVVEGCSGLTLLGKTGDVNIETSCGSVKMCYGRGSTIITPKHSYGSTATEPNVFVTSPYGNSGCGLHLRVVTQSEYDQMSSHDMTTIYFISGC